MGEPGRRAWRSRLTDYWLGPRQLRRVWLLTALLAIAGAALFVLVVRELPRPGSEPIIPWWLFVAVVAVIEFPLIDLHVRNETHSFTLGELALCLGLFLVPPEQFVLAAVLGATIAKLRLPPIKLAFNMALWMVEATVATTVVHLVAGPADPFGPRGVAATYISMALVGGIGVSAVLGAIALAQRGISHPSILIATVIGSAVTVANTGLGVIAAFLAVNNPQLLVALVGPVAVLFLAYRAFIAERQEHQRLQVVYAATRSILEAPEIGTAIGSVLLQAREVFRVEVAQIVLYPERAGEPLVVRTIGSEGDEIRTSPLGSIDGTVFASVGSAKRSELVRFDAETRAGALPDCDARLREALVAPLQGERRVVGAIAVANKRLGDAGAFDTADLRLLETLAGHAGVAIGNGRLERTLSELQALQAELARRATHDALTGLANRDHFEAALRNELRAGGGSDIGLVYVDLDDFKAVNDTFGHAAGDQTLRELAARLRSCLRENDLAGRLGGDEFAVMLQGVGDVEQLARLADRVQSALERPIPWQGATLEPRVSLGITHAAGATDAEALLSDGDTAMYHAKRSGKGRSAIFDLAMRDANASRADLVQDIAAAIDRGELALHYQPIVSLADRRVAAVEALVRWNRPGWGTLSPAAFMPLAEEAGLAPMIGRWVGREACAQVSRWRAAGPGESTLGVAVNVSIAQLDDAGFADSVLFALEAAGMPPDALTLEVTERVLTAQGGGGREPLSALRARGVRVALDDFGTGMSSLAQLGDYPVDIMKIPGDSVAAGVTHRPGLVDALVTIGRTLDIPTIAEMVETPEQVDRLERLGCDLVQGHVFAPAMPPAELERWLLAGGVLAARPQVSSPS